MNTVTVQNDKCKACSLCVRACPKNVLKLGSNINLSGYQYVIVADEQACIGCGNCAISCPDRVLSVYQDKTA